MPTMKSITTSMDESTHIKENIDFRRNLALMRKTGMFCDANICIPGESKTLPVHRAIMSSCSEFFRSLFTNGLQETLTNEVTIQGISMKMMEMVIDYAYTKEVTITTDIVEELFAAADRFNVLGLLQECIDFFASEIAPENCIGFLRFARYYNNKELGDLCWVFVTSHFKEITERSDEFSQLEPEELYEIISDDKLNAHLEDDVYEAVMKWTDFAPRERKEHVTILLEAVRFPFITEECFKDKILHRRDLKRGPCMDRILESYDMVKKYRSTRDPSVKSKTFMLTQTTMPRIPNQVIIVLGGWAKEGVTDSVETYDKVADQWFEIRECELPRPRAYHGTVTIRDKIYVAGGFDGSNYLNGMVMFDVSKKKWEEKASMYMSRCYVSVVEIDGVIYACGGYDGRQRHNSMERYDRTRNQWTLVTPMFNRRSDAGATTLRGKLYIAGGFDGTACLLTAEMYDPVADQWTLLTQMAMRRSGVSLVACEDHVYAVGGYDGHRRLETVEYFDHIRGLWHSATSMLLGRSNFSCVVMDGNIYAMGGYDGEKTSPEMECYRSDKKTWYAMNDMKIGRSAVSACAVRDIYNTRDFSFHGNGARATDIDEIFEETETATATKNTEFARRLNKWRTSPNARGNVTEI
ncbi:kelch-like protein 10 [Dreissena polymorpha]|uniref:kelch-like protein 10 n=1 Tax=Dreissena polymorpha TaxID=45954 RepID=UPI002263D953|nr:kelch-like protein 10 [Dreissena polymorpha]